MRLFGRFSFICFIVQAWLVEKSVIKIALVFKIKTKSVTTQVSNWPVSVCLQQHARKPLGGQDWSTFYGL